MLSARQSQLLIAAVFLTLGAFCLLVPKLALELSIRSEWLRRTDMEALLMACFGAQACLAGLFAATARFTRMTFLVYGLALLPFFWFDWYFYFTKPILTEFGLLDAVGNAFMLFLCVTGYRRSSR